MSWLRTRTLRFIGGGIVFGLLTVALLGLILASCLPHTARIPSDDLLLPLPTGWSVVEDSDGGCSGNGMECGREFVLAAPDEPVETSLEVFTQHLVDLNWEIDDEPGRPGVEASRGEHLWISVVPLDDEGLEGDFEALISDCCGW